jgi:uncharacterized protein (DUF1800 family)
MSSATRWLSAAMVSTALVISACGGGGGSGGGSTPGTPPIGGSPPPPPPPPPATKIESEEEASRFLAQATFGGTKSQIENLQDVDSASFLQTEFSKPATFLLPDVLAQPRDADGNLPWNGISTIYWNQIITADDQLRQRMAFALGQILVYSDISDGNQTRRAYYQDILTRNAFGNFRDLLQEVTYSPAMGEWLTYMRNRKGNLDTGRMPDENYAREVLQLFSIGLFEMNMDGSAKLNADGNEIETYTNDDIIGLARVFTGLAYDASDDSKFWEYSEEANYRPMRMFEDKHSPLEKTFLGTTIPEGTPGDETITRALDTIFEHPNVAPFISRQLIQRFTQSNPEPAYVRRVAEAFESGLFVAETGERFGSTGRGDLTATLAAVLLDESLFDTAGDDASVIIKGKVREPVLRFTHWARAFDLQNVDSYNEGRLRQTNDPVDGLGQHPFRSPSVFNFYRPGYVAPGTMTGDRNMTVPELQLVNESTTVGYLNFMTEFAFDRGWQVDGDTPSFVPNYDEELALLDTPTDLVEHLDVLLTGGRMTDIERDEIVAILDELPINTSEPDREATDRLQKVQVAVTLVLNSPSYTVTW